MSEASERLKRDRQKITSAFAAAVKRSVPASSSLNIAFFSFILCLIGATLAHANLNTFFFVAAIASGLVWFHLWGKSGRRLAFSGGKAAALAVALTSQAAMQNGNIKKPIGTQEMRSYTLVSMVKIRVYGE